MRINNKYYQTIWYGDDGYIYAIDQRKLPHSFEILQLRTFEDVLFAIKEMVVRGAPLIGVAAAYGMYLAIKDFNNTSTCAGTTTTNNNNNSTNSNNNSNNIINGTDSAFDFYIAEAANKLKKTRPTAVNLAWAVDSILAALSKAPQKSANEKELLALSTALFIEKNDILCCNKIGQNGVELIKKIYQKKKDCVNILTHCNAGWLAAVDFGTAIAPIYASRDAGIPVHVWVDETRPRNQGAALTAFELLHEEIPHTLISDNTGGYLMQNNMVDIVIVGADRIAKNGDAANKIGTYLKALAAKDNKIDFYVAAPTSTFDEKILTGKDITIEERNISEVLYVSGLTDSGELTQVRIAPEGTNASNYAFDITPKDLISAWITEKEIIFNS